MRPSQSFVIVVTALLAIFTAGCTVHTQPARVRAAAGVEVRSRPAPRPTTVVTTTHRQDAYVHFYEALDPYGEWMNTPVCGQHFGPVWRPHASVVGRNFMPYATGGEWVPTDQGWSFVSDWDWGWAAFHYGRWCPDPRYGWVWVPGTEWAPAWVDWQYGGGYVGWAPLPPPGVALRNDFFIFVDGGSFAGRRVTRYALPRERVIEARRVTRRGDTVMTHRGYSWRAGPPPAEIRAAGGGEVRPVQVVPPPPGKVRRVEIRSHR